MTDLTIDQIERACQLAELAGEGVGVTLKANELRMLLAENALLREVLEAVEWVDGDGFDYCPSCYAKKDKGHAPDCLLQRALKVQP